MNELAKRFIDAKNADARGAMFAGVGVNPSNFRG